MEKQGVGGDIRKTEQLIKTLEVKGEDVTHLKTIQVGLKRDLGGLRKIRPTHPSYLHPSWRNPGTRLHPSQHLPLEYQSRFRAKFTLSPLFHILLDSNPYEEVEDPEGTQGKGDVGSRMIFGPWNSIHGARSVREWCPWSAPSISLTYRHPWPGLPHLGLGASRNGAWMHHTFMSTNSKPQ